MTAYLATFAAGVGFAAIVAFIAVALNAAAGHWARADAAKIAARAATSSFAADWIPQVEDVAAIEAEHPSVIR